MPSRKKVFTGILSLIAIQVAVSVFGAVFFLAPADNELIYEGVLVENIDLGGLDKSAAEEKLTRALEPGLRNSAITLTFRSKQWTLPYSQLGIYADYKKTVEEAYNTGRGNNHFLKMFDSFRIRMNEVELPLAFRFDEEKMRKSLQELAAEINRSPKNAGVILLDNKLQVTPEQKGYRLDEEASLQAIKNAVIQRKESCRLTVRQVAAEVSAGQLKDVRDDLAVAVTGFDAADKNRRANIILAAESINNSLVKPGETFSFNYTVGQRTVQRGYKNAKVISNSNLTDGIGGGVCQVSTTLYRAVLMAGLHIVERHPHSLPPDYVPIGQDAAVADGQLDLKFKNNTAFPVLIAVSVSDSELLVRLIGKKQGNKKYRLVSDIYEIIEPKVTVKKDGTLPKGETTVLVSGQKGYRVKVFRVTEPEGKKELVSEDYYKPLATVVRVGTKTNKDLRNRK
ncbi:VanW family protein [Thermincola potens]|uniref:VanW family protein n=1 Tax=Thermincola potens (strain JR) TaxID=635013 RepID=D5XA64_THEPJ|nr:VanW family protein [Thermincola potens]ADG83197.1 VanW family protein [Thermincola potens JR]